MKDFKRGGFNSAFKPAFKKPWESKGGNFGGGKSFADKKPFGASSDRPMYSAVCTSCGKPCQVPFKPVSGKDVLCNDCFAKARGEETFVRDDFRSNDRPTRVSYSERPSFRSNDRGVSRPWENKSPSSNGSSGNNDAVLKQLTSVSAKLDQLISLIAVSNNKSQGAKTETSSTPKDSESTIEKKSATPKSAKKVSSKKISKKK